MANLPATFEDCRSKSSVLILSIRQALNFKGDLGLWPAICIVL